MSEPARTVRVVDIIGNAEVRRLAGRLLTTSNRKTDNKPITRATLIAWREREDFPAPIRRLDSGDVWDRREVRAWLEQRRSK
jgi:hypothetical protein